MTKYYPGNKIGPYGSVFIKRLPKQRGIFECSFCGKHFETKIARVVSGVTRSCGCAYAKYKEGDRLGPSNILLLERLSSEKNEYKGKFECPYCKTIFVSRISSIVYGSTQSCGCQKVANLKNQRFGRLVAIRPTEKRQGTCIVWECLCDCGRTHYVGVNHLTHGKTRSCGKCNLTSIGEERILKFLEDKQIIFQTQKRFKECRDIKPLPFDFYLPNYNCCIEYDGLGHYQENCSGGWRTLTNVQKTQFHDQIKTSYCKKHDIKLIRISYKEYSQIEEILKRELKI